MMGAIFFVAHEQQHRHGLLLLPPLLLVGVDEEEVEDHLVLKSRVFEPGDDQALHHQHHYEAVKVGLCGGFVVPVLAE